MIKSVEYNIDHEVVARATARRPLLAEHADRTEAERQVVPEVMDALEVAGLCEVLVPTRAGGHGGTMATQLAVAAELARACPSTAWVQTILNITAWGASRSETGVDLFAETAEGKRPRVCGVIAPTGTATPTEGGWLVTGRWPFASGVFHASWFTGGVMLADDEGNVVAPGMAMIPSSDFIVEDTWFVAGMAGTASNTVVVDNAFVPAKRIVQIGDDRVSGHDPSDIWPLGSALSLVIIGPLLGAAQACADLVVEKAPKRAISYTGYGRMTDSMVAVTETARALLDIDSAWLHAFQAAGYVDAIGAGAERDPLEEARLRGQYGYLVELLRNGVDRLLNVAGASSFATSNVMQRHWRDLEVGSRHAFLATNVCLETYGRAIFGHDPTVMIL